MTRQRTSVYRRLSAREAGLVENPAVCEVRLDDLIPAAQRLFDCHQPYRRKLPRMALCDGGITDAVKVLRKYFLTRIAIEELQVSGGDGARAMPIHYFIDDGHWKIRAQADRGHHRHERNLRVLRSDGVYLRLEGNQHVANLPLGTQYQVLCRKP